VQYQRADHTISIPRPQLDSALRFASACASCHAGMTTAQQVAQIRAWWGELKPFQPKPYARFDSLGGILASATPDLELDDSKRRLLVATLQSRDADERAIALAALHLTEGEKRSTRRTLARALSSRADAKALPSDDLRSRWAIALAYMGDQYVSQGRLENAAIAYRRAIEVHPSRARLHLSLANAQRDARDLAGALTSYRRSLELDGRSAIAWVNYAIALNAAGDTASAVDALARATRVNPAEPLAWFNLANIRLLRQDLDSAAILYRKVVELDPSIALAHFQLARVSLMQRDEASALRSLRRGLAFDSSNASAREMAGVLASRIGVPR
jgi:tetratricopeptide (TPR) repeat protein